MVFSMVFGLVCEHQSEHHRFTIKRSGLDHR